MKDIREDNLTFSITHSVRYTLMSVFLIKKSKSFMYTQLSVNPANYIEYMNTLKNWEGQKGT